MIVIQNTAQFFQFSKNQWLNHFFPPFSCLSSVTDPEFNLVLFFVLFNNQVGSVFLVQCACGVVFTCIVTLPCIAKALCSFVYSFALAGKCSAEIHENQTCIQYIDEFRITVQLWEPKWWFLKNSWKEKKWTWWGILWFWYGTYSSCFLPSMSCYWFLSLSLSLETLLNLLILLGCCQQI